MYIKSRIGWQALTKKEYLDSGDYYLITGTDIDEDRHEVDLSRCYFVSRERYEMDDKIQVHEGDIIVTKDGTIGKVAMVKGLDKPATLNSHLFVLRDLSGKLNNRYLHQILNSHIFTSFVESTKTGSTLTGLPQKTIVEFVFPVPNIEEQEKIAGCLDKLDNTITLHQCKCFQDHTCVFDAQIRSDSAYYSATWEQRKLSDLLVLSSDRNDGKYTRDDVLAASLGTELVKKHIYFGLRATDESVKNYRIVSPGDVIYTKSPIKGFPNGIIRTNKGETGIVPTLYCVYHCVDTINPSIIQSYFEDKERLDNYLVPLVNIGARNNVNITDKGFLEGTICIPSNIDEQTRIVELIGKISSTITLHQCKCFQDHTGVFDAQIRSDSAYYTATWEQRKFDEITFPAGIRNKDNLPLEPYSITNDRGFLPQNEAHDDFGYMQNTDRKAYMVVSPNSFGYNPARINVGSIGYYEGAENVIVSSLYEIFKTQDYIDDHFLMHWFKSDLFPRWIEKFQEGSVRQYFYYDKLCECSLTFPSIDEQRKISSLIDSIDTTITLHQCNYVQHFYNQIWFI